MRVCVFLHVLLLFFLEVTICLRFFARLFLLLFCLQAGVVDVPIFSFYMGNVDTDSPTGVLTLGGVNQTHYEGRRRF